MENDVKRITSTVDQLRQETIDFLIDLVKAESQHPPGDTSRAAEVCRRKCLTFCDDIKLVKGSDTCTSIIACVNPGHSPQMVFNSHIDTVNVGELTQWSYPPFSATVYKNRLYGRGSADAKGCVAAMIMAAKALSLSGIKLKGTLVLNPVGDEELGGSLGAGYIVGQGLLNPDYAVIGESTRNQVGVAEKGLYWFKITTLGQTAHGSTPWLGKNAINMMLQFLNLLEERVGKSLGGKTHPLTPPPSLNIGVIRGGINTNVVADRCEVEIDRRILPTESLLEARKEIEDLLKELSSRDSDFRYEISTLALGNPIETNVNNDIVKWACESRNLLGLPERIVGYQQVSDGRFFNDAGVPTIIMGPGESEEAHTPNESIDLDQVLEAAKIYALLAWKALS